MKYLNIVSIICVIISIVTILSSAHADEIVTGGNVSAEARAKIDPAKPNSTFETQDLPPEPDYSLPGSWAALPEMEEAADLEPANTKYPQSEAKAAVDVFFVHPTTAVAARDNWNIPINDPLALQDVDNIMAYCASVFNAAARVYAPRYRAAKLYAFFDDKTTSGIKAVDLAYRDVERAFLYYLKEHSYGRPFILAGHSQGSIHLSRLLQEHIIGTPLMDRLVAAYLIGGTAPAEIPGIKPSRSATDIGVLIGWNTYTKDGDPTIFTNGLIGWINGSYTKMGGRPLIQTNPLSWKLNGPAVPALQNPGSLPFIEGPKGGAPSLVPAVCGADASGDAVIINKPEVPGFTYAGAGDIPVLNPAFGDYHSYDYTLFYESLRKNAIDRAKAFIEREG